MITIFKQQLVSVLVLVFCTATIATTPVQEDTPANENEWTELIAKTPTFEGFDTQRTLWDGTRPDLYGPYAIEVDWSYKWKEGVGQACYYAAISDKPAGLLLLFKEGTKTPAAQRDAYKAIIAAKRAGIERVFFYDCTIRKFVK